MNYFKTMLPSFVIVPVWQSYRSDVHRHEVYVHCGMVVHKNDSTTFKTNQINLHRVLSLPLESLLLFPFPISRSARAPPPLRLPLYASGMVGDRFGAKFQWLYGAFIFGLATSVVFRLSI